MLTGVAVASLVVGALALARATARDGAAPVMLAEGRYRGSEPPATIAAPDFSLRDYTGSPLRMREFRGKAVAITFLDTQCTEACPVIAAQIARGIELLSPPDRARVAAIAITVDPDEDTPRRVRRFLREQGALGKLRYAVGSLAELRPVWGAFKVLPSAETGDDDIHSAPVRIFDPRGRWVSTLHAGGDLTAASLAHDLRVALGG